MKTPRRMVRIQTKKVVMELKEWVMSKVRVRALEALTVLVVTKAETVKVTEMLLVLGSEVNPVC
jgi:hypothetical protein